MHGEVVGEAVDVDGVDFVGRDGDEDTEVCAVAVAARRLIGGGVWSCGHRFPIAVRAHGRVAVRASSWRPWSGRSSMPTDAAIWVVSLQARSRVVGVRSGDGDECAEGQFGVAADEFFFSFFDGLCGPSVACADSVAFGGSVFDVGFDLGGLGGDGPLRLGSGDGFEEHDDVAGVDGVGEQRVVSQSPGTSRRGHSFTQ